MGWKRVYGRRMLNGFMGNNEELWSRLMILLIVLLLVLRVGLPQLASNCSNDGDVKIIINMTNNHQMTKIIIERIPLFYMLQLVPSLPLILPKSTKHFQVH